jgi:hypothetical protein
MGFARAPFAVTTTGPVDDPSVVGVQTYFALSPDVSDLFVGVSGTGYSNLTFGVSGGNDGSRWYDLGAYTTDFVGPLVGPLNPTNGSNVGYLFDVRPYSLVQINVVTLTGTVNVEVKGSNFFPQRGGIASAAANLQTVKELRAIRSVLVNWLGLPDGPIIAMQAELTGTGLGGVFQGQE